MNEPVEDARTPATPPPPAEETGTDGNRVAATVDVAATADLAAAVDVDTAEPSTVDDSPDGGWEARPAAEADRAAIAPESSTGDVWSEGGLEAPSDAEAESSALVASPDGQPEAPPDAAASPGSVAHEALDDSSDVPSPTPAEASPEDDDPGDSADGSLAAQVADWTPPWQREARPDTPADEPIDPVELTHLREADRPPPVPRPEPEATSAEPAASEPAPDDSPPLAHDLAPTLEAILLVCEEPVSALVLAQTLGRPEDEVSEALRDLSAEYTGDNRGFDLRRQAGGWRFYTREEFAPYVERFVLDGQQVRLTKAALETLSVVAYKQPVTRGRISAIRGVNCDGVIRTLTLRGLIEECGSEPDSGAHLYRTTSLFLEKLGLNSIAELPPLAPFLPDDITQIGESSEN